MSLLPPPLLRSPPHQYRLNEADDVFNEGTGSSVATQFATDYHILIIQRNLSGVPSSLFLSLRPLNWRARRERGGEINERNTKCKIQSARATIVNRAPQRRRLEARRLLLDRYRLLDIDLDDYLPR